MSKRRKRMKNKKVFYQAISGVCLLGSIILGTYYIATIPQRQQNEATVNKIEQKIEVLKKENKTKTEEVEKLKTEYQGLEGQSKELVQKVEDLNKRVAEEDKKSEAFDNKLKTKKEEVKKHLLDVNNKLTSTYESNKENYPKLELVQLENGLKHIRYKETTMDEAKKGLEQASLSVGELDYEGVIKKANDDRLDNQDVHNLYDFKIGHDGSWDNGYWLSEKLIEDLQTQPEGMSSTLGLLFRPESGGSQKELDALPYITKGYMYNFLAYGDPYAYIGWPKEIIKREKAGDRLVAKGTYDYDYVMGTNFSGQNDSGFLNHITYENN